ncbi:MAG: glycosyltransferase [Polaromonas sp.]
MIIDKNIKTQLPEIFRVTVAIPTFNRLDLLKRSIESVLAQNYPELEIVVSDNASTDGTKSYLLSLRDPRVKILLNSENIGMVANWDRCLKAATGCYFLLLSDDDALLGGDAVDQFVNGFTQTGAEKIGVVFSDVKLERAGRTMLDAPSGKKTMYSSVELITTYFSGQVSIVPCATLMRTKDLQEFGGYASFGANLAADACAWMSLALKYGKVARVAESLSVYRIHQSLSSSSVEIWDEDFKKMRLILRTHQKQMTRSEFLDVERAVDSAFNLIPLGYIVRSLKYDDKYGLLSTLNDFILWRKRLLSLNSIYFILKIICFKIVKNIKYLFWLKS